MSVSAVAKVHAAPSQEAIEGYLRAMRPFWHPVLPAAEALEGTPKTATLLDVPLVIARLNGEWVAMDDVCRHFQAQLSLGEIRQIAGHGDCLMCPYHGWSYAADGQCVDIPQLSPGREIPASARVPSYPVQERYGLIWVCLEQEARYPLPDLPDLDNPAFLTGPLRDYTPWHAAAPRVIMAALDDTHGPWVHNGMVGDRSHPEPPQHRVWGEGNTLKVEIQMLQPNNAAIAEGDTDKQFREVLITTTVGIPNTIHFDIRATDSADKHRTLIWQAVCPVSWDRTRTFWGSARNYDFDKPVYNEAFEALQDTLREQDKRIVESQRPWLLPPFWTKVELPLRPADLPLIEYHNWLDELGIAVPL
jgi:phenylpropionate dioxygenase-like ring-hydroxylating dioxygenase large terminal subunit